MIPKPKCFLTVSAGMRTVVLMMILLSSIIIGAAQDSQLENRYLTAGYSNGRVWHAMPSHEKLMFIVGFNEGINAATVASNQTVPETLYLKLTNNEIVSQLDKFYADSINNPIPITYGYMYVAMKSKGASEVDLQGFLSVRRKAAASTP
jgi:hypothetical protein